MKRLKKLTPLILVSSLACHVAYAMHTSRENADTDQKQAPPQHHSAASSSHHPTNQLSLYNPGVLGKAKPLIPLLERKTMQEIFRLEEKRRAQRPTGQKDPLINLTDTLYEQGRIMVAAATQIEEFLNSIKWKINPLWAELRDLHRETPSTLRSFVQRHSPLTEFKDDPTQLPLEPLELLALMSLYSPTVRSNHSYLPEDPIYFCLLQLNQVVDRSTYRPPSGKSDFALRSVYLDFKFARQHYQTALQGVQQMTADLNDPVKRGEVESFAETLALLQPLLPTPRAVEALEPHIQTLLDTADTGTMLPHNMGNSSHPEKRPPSAETMTTAQAEASGLPIVRLPSPMVETPRNASKNPSPDSFSGLSIDSADLDLSTPRAPSSSKPVASKPLPPATTVDTTPKPPRAPTPGRARPAGTASASSTVSHIPSTVREGIEDLDTAILGVTGPLNGPDNGEKRRHVRTLKTIFFNAGLLTPTQEDQAKEKVISAIERVNRISNSGNIQDNASDIQEAFQILLKSRTSRSQTARADWVKRLEEKKKTPTATAMDVSTLS